MEWQNSLLYIVPALFMLFLIFPLVFNLRVTMQPFQNIVIFSLCFFKRKLFYSEISISGKKIRIANDKKVIYKEIEFDKAKFDTMQHFVKKVSKKIKIKSIDVLYNVGVGDAFQSAMLCGELNQLCMQSFVYLKHRNPTASLSLSGNVSYNDYVFVLVANNKFSFSTLDILSTFVYAFVTRKRNE